MIKVIYIKLLGELKINVILFHFSFPAINKFLKFVYISFLPLNIYFVIFLFPIKPTDYTN